MVVIIIMVRGYDIMQSPPIRPNWCARKVSNASASHIKYDTIQLKLRHIYHPKIQHLIQLNPSENPTSKPSITPTSKPSITPTFQASQTPIKKLLNGKNNEICNDIKVKSINILCKIIKY